MKKQQSKHINMFGSWVQKTMCSVFCTIAFLSSNFVYPQENMSNILEEAKIDVYENPEKAIKKGLEIYASADSLKNKVRALMLVSTGYSSKRNYEKSLVYAIRSKAYFSKLKNPDLKVNILNQIAVQYQQLSIYDKAIDYLNQALELMENVTKKSSKASLVGYNYAVRGFIYREQMSCDIALNYFDKSIEAYKKVLANEPLMNANLSVLTYNKGNCLLVLGKVKLAKTAFLKSIVYARKIGANSLIAFAQKGLGEVQTLQGNYESSLETLYKAIEISENVGDLVLNKELYKAFSNNYLALSDWKSYKLFQNKFTATLQQIEETERKTINQSIRNSIQENEDKITALKSFYRPFQIILLILGCISLFIIFRQIGKSQQKQREIRKKIRFLKFPMEKNNQPFL